MRDRIKKLIEERQAIWKQMCDIMAGETRDASGAAVLTGEALQRYEALERDLDARGREIETCERHLALEAQLNAPKGEGERRSTGGAEDRADALTDREEYRSAFDAMVRRGVARLTPEQRDVLAGGFVESRDLGVGTGAAGGYLVPQGFLLKITERRKYFGPMRQLSNVIETTSGNAMPWPNNDDTGNVATVLGENTTVTELDIALGSKTLQSYVWTTGLIKVSYQLLNDSAFDVEAFVSRKFGQRLGRGQNTAFTTGNGTTTAQGILSGAGGAPASASTPVFTAPTGYTTKVDYGVLVETQHAVDVAYRFPGPHTGWQMHDQVLKVIRKLVDSNGRPLWVPETSLGSIVSGAQGELLGHPVFVNNDMPATLAANEYTIGFGDWEDHYIIRDVLGFQMIRLDERFADQLQVGFLGFARTDGRVDDAYAVAYMQQSAT